MIFSPKIGKHKIFAVAKLLHWQFVESLLFTIWRVFKCFYEQDWLNYLVIFDFVSILAICFPFGEFAKLVNNKLAATTSCNLQLSIPPISCKWFCWTGYVFQTLTCGSGQGFNRVSCLVWVQGLESPPKAKPPRIRIPGIHCFVAKSSLSPIAYYQTISNMIYDFKIFNTKFSQEQRKVFMINSNSIFIFVKYMEGDMRLSNSE